MKIDNYIEPKSSFLSVEKDFSLIVKKLISSSRLQKLLYYKTRDSLDREKLNKDQILELLEKNIKIVPKINLTNTVETYITISFDDFFPSENPEFRNNIIIFDIICHTDLWNLGNYQLRPYKIAGEIDAMFDGQKLTGIGTTSFKTCQQVNLGEGYISLILVYDVTHGEEDQINMLNEEDWLEFIKVFDLENNE